MARTQQRNDGASLDPLVFGANGDHGLVAVEHDEKRSGADEVILYVRRKGETVQEREPFRPFIVADERVIAGCPVEHEEQKLGGGAPLNVCATFLAWRDWKQARSWLAQETGLTPTAPGAPYLCVGDPVQQHLVTSGRTMFLGMAFDDLKRLQVDIECYTSEGYEFCNAQREGDRIIAIAMGDQSGWTEVLSGAELGEKALLERFVAILRERDPDVIEGHNIFNFDLPYIVQRAKRHRVKLALGRDGSVPQRRPSRFSAGERTISYDRFGIAGRHVVDTLFLVHSYDISHRSLSGYGLKEVAVHFGFAAPDRTYVDGPSISATFDSDPDTLMKYVRDDIVETREVGRLLSHSSFIQAQMLPYSYQNICVRGNATKIDSLMLREYLRQGHAIPRPDLARSFAGGYTDMFVTGIVQNVHHCDVRSLYPSLMLTRKIAPRHDELGVFLKLLDVLRTFRLDAKAQMAGAEDKGSRDHYDALQATFKILINSFYGYLGFSQARFSDFDAAEQVTAQGRELLRAMIEWLREHGAQPVEIDTDGIYFVPPAGGTKGKGRGAKGKRGEKTGGAEPISGGELEAFRKTFADALPEGIEIEFDGEYRSMYSYKMKNYALLCEDGEIVIKGAALKSRGLEPFQRDLLSDIVRLKLEQREDEIPALKESAAAAINAREWPVEKFAKTERLQDAPATYAAKIKGAKRARNAGYELALKSEREYRAGDQLSYYVTGSKKSVSVHEAAKLVSEWDPENRDENVPYYLSKLDALFKKFADVDAQGELGL